MPVKTTVYDKGCVEVKDADGKITQAKQDAHTIEMWDIDAREAVKNDPGRYSLGKPKNFGAPPVAAARPAARPAPAPVKQPAPANDAT